MKRLLYGIALILALTLGSGTAAAHTITVTTPNGTVVRDGEDLAKNLTPRLFDGRGNYIGPDQDPNEGPKQDSAASNGTNTACEAVPENGVVYISGGDCHPDAG